MRDILKAGIAGMAMSMLLAGWVQAAEVAPADVKFNDENAIADALTDGEGDPDAGREFFAGRKLGNCLACHALEDQKDQLFHGNVGPALDGVADRYSVAQLRAIVVNSKKVFGEQTIMPGFYSLEVGKDPRKELEGKTILSAEQTEDIVAYLATLKE